MRKNILLLLISINLILCFNCPSSQKKVIPSVIKPKVLIIIFNPIIESQGSKRLNEVLNWNEPDSLAEVNRKDILEVRNGYLDYQIVNRIEVDEYPIKLDGFRYTHETFLKCWRERKGFHQPDNVDYHAIFTKFNIIDQVEKGEIDEVWCFAFPYSGFWGTTMAGKGVFYCISDPVLDMEHCSRRFITFEPIHHDAGLQTTSPLEI